MTTDPFKKIKRVEAPPFLFTRIQARIRQTEADFIPTQKLWYWATSLAVLLVVNASVALLYLNNASNITATSSFLHLVSDYTLY